MKAAAVHIIANYQAGFGIGRRKALVIEKELQKQKIPFHFYPTKYPGHAVQLAAEVAARLTVEEERLLVLGGDGTLQEVLTGLSRSDCRTAVGYIPAGTGNDFAAALSIDKKTLPRLNHLLETDQQQEIELLAYTDMNTEKSGICLNSTGFGFDGEVVQVMNSPRSTKKWLQVLRLNRFSYLYSILDAFSKRTAFQAEVRADGITRIYDNVFLIAAMNHPFFGGGIRINPTVRQGDHHISIMVLQHITGPVILKLLPKVLYNASHVHSAHFTALEATQCEFCIRQPVYGQTDGELLEKSRQHYRFQLTAHPFWK